MIHSAVEKYLLAKNALKRRPDGMLWVSDLGNHPYKAMSRILRVDQQAGFGVDVLNKMQQGNLLEPDTIECLRFSYPNVLTQFPLYNDTWSGYADAIIGHGELPSPVIVEHKGTSDKNFDYKESLPRPEHVCQLWLYGQLYQERYGVTPQLVLYYRSWSNHAEFQLEERNDFLNSYIMATGVADGRYTERYVRVHPLALRLELEGYYTRHELPSDDGVDTWTYAKDAYDRLTEGLHDTSA